MVSTLSSDTLVKKRKRKRKRPRKATKIINSSTVFNTSLSPSSPLEQSSPSLQQKTNRNNESGSSQQKTNRNNESGSQQKTNRKKMKSSIDNIENKTSLNSPTIPIASGSPRPPLTIPPENENENESSQQLPDHQSSVSSSSYKATPSVDKKRAFLLMLEFCCDHGFDKVIHVLTREVGDSFPPRLYTKLCLATLLGTISQWEKDPPTGRDLGSFLSLSFQVCGSLSESQRIRFKISSFINEIRVQCVKASPEHLDLYFPTPNSDDARFTDNATQTLRLKLLHDSTLKGHSFGLFLTTAKATLNSIKCELGQSTLMRIAQDIRTRYYTPKEDGIHSLSVSDPSLKTDDLFVSYPSLKADDLNDIIEPIEDFPPKPPLSPSPLDQRIDQTLSSLESPSANRDTTIPDIKSIFSKPRNPSTKRKSVGLEESNGSHVPLPKRIPFSDQEHRNLVKGVQRLGIGKWKEILHMYPFNNRTSINLKDKWRNLLTKFRTPGAVYKKYGQK